MSQKNTKNVLKLKLCPLAQGLYCEKMDDDDDDEWFTYWFCNKALDIRIAGGGE